MKLRWVHDWVKRWPPEVRECGSWDVKFIRLAEYIASWSKDPDTKIGAVIVNEKNSIVSVGFNGLPRGIEDTNARISRPLKYKLMIHAELNALTNAALNGAKTEGCTLYVSTYHPCHGCAGLLIQSGITRIVCPEPDLTNERWKDSFELSVEILQEKGVVMNYYKDE